MNNISFKISNYFKLSVSLIASLLLAFSLFGCAQTQSASTQSSTNKNTETQGKKIGISWSSDDETQRDTKVYDSLVEAGVTPVYLDQVIDNDLPYEENELSDTCENDLGYLNTECADKVKQNTYHNSNIEEILNDIDGVVFTGGEDVSPSLYKDAKEYEAPIKELGFNSTRDVSDYLLVSYCIDKDIESLGICRGMQMVAVVSGCEMIQDIPTYYNTQGLTYNSEHRNTITTADGLKQYAKHDVNVTSSNSFLYKIFRKDVVNDVPSVHHQAVKSVEGTNLKVVGVTPTNGIDIIEAVERADKKNIYAVQFHPEAAVAKYLANEDIADLYMDKESAVKIFSWIFNS